MPTSEKIFADRGIKAKGNTLAPSDIKFFSFEKEELRLNERRMKLIVERAESFLDYEIMVIPLSAYRRYVIDGNRREMQSYFCRNVRKKGTLYKQAHRRNLGNS